MNRRLFVFRRNLGGKNRVTERELASEDLAGLIDVVPDLCYQRLHVFEFFFRSQEFHESNFDISVVDVAIEIEQMDFEHAV